VHVIIGFAEAAFLTSSRSCWCSVLKAIEMSFEIGIGRLRGYQDSQGWSSWFGGYLLGNHGLLYEQQPSDDQWHGNQLSFDEDSC